MTLFKLILAFWRMNPEQYQIFAQFTCSKNLLLPVLYDEIHDSAELGIEII